MVDILSKFCHVLSDSLIFDSFIARLPNLTTRIHLSDYDIQQAGQIHESDNSIEITFKFHIKFDETTDVADIELSVGSNRKFARRVNFAKTTPAYVSKQDHKRASPLQASWRINYGSIPESNDGAKTVLKPIKQATALEENTETIVPIEALCPTTHRYQEHMEVLRPTDSNQQRFRHMENLPDHDLPEHLRAEHRANEPGETANTVLGERPTNVESATT